jgi:hypothetical protein
MKDSKINRINFYLYNLDERYYKDLLIYGIDTNN